jgi:hypothetical protein
VLQSACQLVVISNYVCTRVLVIRFAGGYARVRSCCDSPRLPRRRGSARVALPSESVTACQAQAASDTTAGLVTPEARVRVPSLPLLIRA